MKRIKYAVVALAALFATSCSDFLDTTPHDAISPSTTWKSAEDVNKFLTGTYAGWADSYSIFYLDAASDIAYNNFPWEGWRPIGNGTWTASSTGASFYGFNLISRCNNVVNNIDRAKISDKDVYNNLLGQALAIRAYAYARMNFWYGGVPIMDDFFPNAEAAKVPRNTEAEVWEHFDKDIDRAISLLPNAPTESGRIAKGGALAIKMRYALYRGNWQQAADAAKSIMDLNLYALDKDYAAPFTIAGNGSKEIIVAEEHDEVQNDMGIFGQLYNNGDGGWSSILPTQNLVDLYLMKDGMTKEESPLYDKKHPFANRDPRMAKTILYPGCDYWKGVYNTLDKQLDGTDNPDYPTKAANSSKTALTWAKYLYPKSQYNDMWTTAASIVIFRYAEVLLSRAEALNELSGPSEEVYALIDQLRTRAGMPAVDRAKYATKDALREVIRRERSVELAGEGFRRADIVRWKDASGKMVAETVLNGNLTRITGTVDMKGTNPETRATIADERDVIEDRAFKPEYRYWPIPQSAIDRNPKLKQNAGY
jgi:susD family protein